MAKKKVVDVEVKETKKDLVKEEKLEKEMIEETKENKKISNHSAVFFTAVGTFTVCLLIFVLVYEYYLKNLVIETTRLEKDVTITDTGIAESVEKVYDAVVVIETYINGRAYGSATGFVYKTDDKNAYIVTNNHVISNITSVKARFSNGEKYDVSIVGGDDYDDVAVLSIDKNKILEVASTGDNSKMKVGDTTFAIGAPIDSDVYSWTVTRGILSGKNRVVSVSDFKTSNVVELLQTDTPINNGNSGGPLCNSNGEVIGMINMKLASSLIEGIGFAIPIEVVSKCADDIISNKTVARPYMGVSIYESKDGVVIESVEKNGAASKAGLKQGDIITKINNNEVDDYSHLKYELYKYNVGDKITVTVKRDGKEKSFDLTLKSNTSNKQ